MQILVALRQHLGIKQENFCHFHQKEGAFEHALVHFSTIGKITYLYPSAI